MLPEKKQFNYLLICLFVSLFFHVGGIYLIQKYSLWFYSPIKESLPIESKPTLSKSEKTKILRQVTNLISKEKKPKTWHALQENETEFSSKVQTPLPLENNEFKFKKSSFNSLHWAAQQPLEKKVNIENLISKNKEVVRSKFLNKIENIGYTKDKKVENIAIQCQKEDNSSYFAKSHLLADLPKTAKIKKIPKEKSALTSDSLVHSSVKIRQKQTPNISTPRLPSLGQLSTYTYEDDFDVDISVAPIEGNQYIFAVTLIPKPTIDLARIKQNFFFLIDKSNTIQAKRLKTTRDAVYHGISSINEEDTFNIIAFDNKVHKLFPAREKPSKTSQQKAKRFLIGLKLASFFASSNIYNCLYTASNLLQEEGAINNIILLSNGQGLAHDSLEHYFMGQWTNSNNGKASLFSIAMNHDSHMTDLELLSVINRGWLMNSPTRGGINRKLLKLLKMIKNPIIQDVTCTAISTTPQRALTLFTPFKQSPNLYANEPYVILGKTNQLEDFVLTLQGKNQDKWINVKKNIQLSNAKQDDTVLEEQWALNEAWDAYRNYLKSADPTYLMEANKILKPYNIEPAFK